jgi:uncharacterized repeat protein (TIGR03803 family)
MRANINHLLLVWALIVSVVSISAGQLGAQVFTTLYNFTNNIGSDPVGTLFLSGNVLYGTTQSGGSSGKGTVFAVNTDGTGFTNLHTFIGSDGADPYSALILSGNSLYGAAQGNISSGTVFKLNTDGTDFTNLSALSDFLGLTLSGNTFYGVSGLAGDAFTGTLFKLNTDGSGLATVYAFSPVNYEETNSDGANPVYPLLLSGDTLYGTAGSGGIGGDGTVFKVNTNGDGFTVLHTFTALSSAQRGGTNGDGAIPGAMVLSGDTLYGTTIIGGNSGNGVVFAVNADGTGYTVLHTFAARSGPNSTNSDGSDPSPYLLLSGNTLYGTTGFGGSSSNGTVFAVNTDGSDFTVLHNFTAYSAPSNTNSDGGSPFGGLILAGTTLYGTAEFGGAGNTGTIFSISLPPQLAITASGPNVILTWPTNVAGLTLQSTPNLVAPAVWTPVSPGPVVVNGLNTVTNPMIGSQQFYRLSQ